MSDPVVKRAVSDDQEFVRFLDVSGSAALEVLERAFEALLAGLAGEACLPWLGPRSGLVSNPSK